MHELETCRNSFFIKSKKNCTEVTGGITCASAHHKLLHGSGMTLYHKVGVTLEKSMVNTITETDSADCPLDSTQPLLLEIQTVKVHGLTAKVMFDKVC